MEFLQAEGVFHCFVPHFLVHEVEEQDAVSVFLHQSLELGIFLLKVGIGIVHRSFLREVFIQLIGVGGGGDITLWAHVVLDVGHKVADLGVIVVQTEQNGIHIHIGGRLVSGAKDGAVDGGDERF